jgi:hypothetical protein
MTTVFMDAGRTEMAAQNVVRVRSGVFRASLGLPAKTRFRVAGPFFLSTWQIVGRREDGGRTIRQYSRCFLPLGRSDASNFALLLPTMM